LISEETAPDFDKILLAFKAIDFLITNTPHETGKTLEAIKQ